MAGGTHKTVFIRIVNEILFLYISIAFIQGSLIIVLSLAGRYIGIDIDLRIIECGKVVARAVAVIQTHNIRFTASGTISVAA